jgi:hypothetical protein
MPTTAAFFAAIVALVPFLRTRVAGHETRIAALAEASAVRYEVPAVVLLSVGLHETLWGLDPRSGGGWGAPRDFQHRWIAGTSDDAAAILANGFVHCHTWERAVSFFRTGNCATVAHRDYVVRVMRLIDRAYDRLGVPPVDHLR